MQKLFLKIKDRWWLSIPFIVLGWITTQILDYVLIQLVGQKEFLAVEISVLLNYKIPLYVIFSYILAFVLGVTTYKLIKIHRISRRDFKILKATYGRNKAEIDITRELNNAVSDNSLYITLSNNIAGDPYPGVPKIGKIKFQHNGEIFDKEYIENEIVLLPMTGLSDSQVKAIISLLISFGAEADVITGAEKALRGRRR